MPKLKKNMPKSSHKKDVHKEDVNSLTPDFTTPMKKKNREGLKVMKAPILQNTEQTEESKSPDDFFMSSTAKLLGSDHTAKKIAIKKHGPLNFREFLDLTPTSPFIPDDQLQTDQIQYKPPKSARKKTPLKHIRHSSGSKAKTTEVSELKSQDTTLLKQTSIHRVSKSVFDENIHPNIILSSPNDKTATQTSAMKKRHKFSDDKLEEQVEEGLLQINQKEASIPNSNKARMENNQKEIKHKKEEDRSNSPAPKSKKLDKTPIKKAGKTKKPKNQMKADLSEESSIVVEDTDKKIKMHR